jgi:hypothetical protein
VVWPEAVSGNLFDSTIHAARVGEDGTVLDVPPLQLAAGTGTYAPSPQAIWDGAAWRVFWDDLRTGNALILTTRIGADGSVLDPSPSSLLGGTAVGATPFAATSPDGRVLVVWADGSGGLNDVLFGWLDPVLGVQSIQRITQPGEFAYSPRARFDGSDFWVTYQRYGNGTWELLGTRVAPGGGSRDSPPVLLATDNDSIGGHELASDPVGRSLLVYARSDFSPGVLAFRLHVRGIQNLAVGQDCPGPDACASGICSDQGLCCDASGVCPVRPELLDLRVGCSCDSTPALSAAAGWLVLLAFARRPRRR